MDEPIVFSQEQTEFLEKAAKRYIWWMTKEEAMMDPFSRFQYQNDKAEALSPRQF